MPHREKNLSASRGNFKVIYCGKFDGIPSRSRNPIVKRLMIGCYFKGQISPFLNSQSVSNQFLEV